MSTRVKVSIDPAILQNDKIDQFSFITSGNNIHQRSTTSKAALVAMLKTVPADQSKEFIRKLNGFIALLENDDSGRIKTSTCATFYDVVNGKEFAEFLMICVFQNPTTKLVDWLLVMSRDEVRQRPRDLVGGAAAAGGFAMILAAVVPAVAAVGAGLLMLSGSVVDPAKAMQVCNALKARCIRSLIDGNELVTEANGLYVAFDGIVGAMQPNAIELVR